MGLPKTVFLCIKNTGSVKYGRRFVRVAFADCFERESQRDNPVDILGVPPFSAAYTSRPQKHQVAFRYGHENPVGNRSTMDYEIETGKNIG